MSTPSERITRRLQESIATKQRICEDEVLVAAIGKVADALITTYRSGGKLLLCGNGGSAADAQHIAAEFSGRFEMERAPLYAEALHVNSSAMTAIANDYGYEQAYARLIQAMGRAGDVLIAISTSGNSPNVVQAARAARERGMQVVGFTGTHGGRLQEHCDWLLAVPSQRTARIQEAHITLGHIITELVEANLFGDGAT